MIEAVILDKRLLVTRFVEGITLADVIRDCLGVKDRVSLIYEAGAEIGKIHSTGATLGNVKPKNIIVSEKDLLLYQCRAVRLSAQ